MKEKERFTGGNAEVEEEKYAPQERNFLLSLVLTVVSGDSSYSQETTVWTERWRKIQQVPGIIRKRREWVVKPRWRETLRTTHSQSLDGELFFDFLSSSRIHFPPTFGILLSVYSLSDEKNSKVVRKSESSAASCNFLQLLVSHCH